MTMNLIIREKRKEIGLTQEQIAESLGVSTPAVNKWEKGTTYPDISLLPTLARLLKIDLNTLLCFNERLSEQEISHFCKEVTDTIHKRGFDSGFTMSIEKVQEYPNCDSLIHTIAMLLDGALLIYGTNIENKEPYETQIKALYERAAKSNDDQIRYKAIFMLVSKYMGVMEYNKAQKMIDLLPERTSLDKKQLQANLFINKNKFSEAAELLERKLLMDVNEIQGILLKLVDIELKEGNNQNAIHLAEVSHKFTKLFDLWDFNSFIAPLEVALREKNIKDSISNLKSMLSTSLTPWEIKKSPLYFHITANEKEDDISKQMLTILLSEIENSPKYEFLHSVAEFQELIKLYHAKCEY